MTFVFINIFNMKTIITYILLSIILLSCQKSNSDCTNGIIDGTETGVDCGGDCAVCETCCDQIKNQNEVQVDCGGNCTPCPIEYPENGHYGVNLLHGNDTIYTDGEGNSFKAIIPEGSSLKIRLKLLSGDVWYYGVNTNIGWTISDYINGEQTFDAINGGETQLKVMDCCNGYSSILISYFENGDTITKEKILIIQ